MTEPRELPKVPIVLIGCGENAQRFCLPILRDYREHADVAAVIVGELDRDQTKKALADVGLDTRSIEIIAVPHCNTAATTRALERLAEKLPEPRAAIVSTISALNQPLSLWCLEHRFHVMVEKPASCPPNCSHELKAARLIVDGMQKLVDAANANSVQLLVARDKRDAHEFMRFFFLLNKLADRVGSSRDTLLNYSLTCG